MIEAAEYVKLLVALIAIIDIPGSIPIFLQQTGRLTSTERLLAALTAAVATCFILLVFAFLGEEVLSLFGITIAAFKVLGGIVVLLIALDLLGLLREEEAFSEAKPSRQSAIAIGIFPMALPLFAGPGAITAVIVYAHEDFHSNHNLIVVAIILSASALLAIGLATAGMLAKLIGPITQIVMNRVLGMVVGALGVEFILEGLAEFFPFATTQ
jgi:multiple antibiotic resistance protein